MSRRSKTSRTCIHCASTFFPANHSAGLYCSHRCYVDHTSGTRRTPPEQRFWPKVQKTDGCWLWTAGQAGDGYGAFGLNRRAIRAHRYSWELFYGPVPNGMNVLHKCDTPSCVRPEHLFLGTQTDNIADMVAKGRQRAPRGTQRPNAKLTADDVQQIRHRIVLGEKDRAIADTYGVRPGLIWLIRHGHAWAHLEPQHTAFGNDVSHSG